MFPETSYIVDKIVENNVFIDETKVIENKEEQKEENAVFLSLFYFQGICVHCQTPVVVFDPEAKLYVLINVVPGMIG